jgi:hypothetical protein
MMRKTVQSRARALEEVFFTEHNSRLLSSLRDGETDASKASALAEVSGIHDPGLLEECLALDVHVATFAALLLAPMLAVAWADGEIALEERHAILRVADRNGIHKGSAAYNLLKGWLQERFPPAIMRAWRSYVRGMLESLTPDSAEALRAEILKDATQVADAAGGFWGFGDRISAAEEAALSEVRTALK